MNKEDVINNNFLKVLYKQFFKLRKQYPIVIDRQCILANKNSETIIKYSLNNNCYGVFDTKKLFNITKRDIKIIFFTPEFDDEISRKLLIKSIKAEFSSIKLEKFLKKNPELVEYFI
jgi:hypothetical protein